MRFAKHDHVVETFAADRADESLNVSMCQLCVPKTLSELMPGWNRLSWRNDGAALFRSGRSGLAIHVEVAA